MTPIQNTIQRYRKWRNPLRNTEDRPTYVPIQAGDLTLYVSPSLVQQEETNQ